MTASAARWPALLLACAALGGCRTLSAPEPLPPGDARPAALLAALGQEADARRSLRGSMRLALDGPAGSVRASQVVVAEQPAHLRIEVQGFLSQTVAVLVTDGERFELLRAGVPRVQTGPVYPGLLWDVAQVDLTPEEAVEVLLGAPRVPEGLVPGAALRLPDGGIRVELGGVDGAAQRVIEWGPDARLRRIEARTPGQSVLWEAEFRDWERTGDGWFAHALELHFPVSQTEVELDFQDVQLNPDLPVDAFVLRLPGNVAAPGGGGA